MQRMPENGNYWWGNELVRIIKSYRPDEMGGADE